MVNRVSDTYRYKNSMDIDISPALWEITTADVGQLHWVKVHAQRILQRQYARFYARSYHCCSETLKILDSHLILTIQWSMNARSWCTLTRVC